MKQKTILFLAGICLCICSSCVKSDDFDALNHDIEIRGEYHPSLGFPVGSCSMNMGELLGIWQTTLCKIEFDENDLLVIKYDTSMHGTFNFSSAKGHKSNAKSEDALFTITKPFSGELPLDLFNNIQTLEHLDFDNVYLTLETFIKGYSHNSNILQMLERYNMQVDLDNIKITIIGDQSSNVIDIAPLTISALMAGENIRLLDPSDPNASLNRFLALKPNKIQYSMNMNVHFYSATLERIISEGGSVSPESYVNDSITLDSISTLTHVSANFPLKVKGFVDYTMNMDLPFDGVEESLSILRDKIDFGDSSYLALRFVNGIPMDFTMTDTLIDELGNIITMNGEPIHLYNTSQTIKGATTKDLYTGGVHYTVADQPSETIMKVPINEKNLNVLLKARKMKLGIRINTDPSSGTHISVREGDKLSSHLYVVINPENQHFSTK